MAERGDLNPGSAKTSLYKGNCRYRLYYGELSNFPLEALRSRAKHKKWRKTVARSRPTSPFTFFDFDWCRDTENQLALNRLHQPNQLALVYGVIKMRIFLPGSVRIVNLPKDE
jgi:hypothetical protein